VANLGITGHGYLLVKHFYVVNRFKMTTYLTKMSHKRIRSKKTDRMTSGILQKGHHL